MAQDFVLHRRSRSTADGLLALSDRPHSILIEIHPARRPVLSGGTTLGALNVYLGALERLRHAGTGPVAIDPARSPSARVAIDPVAIDPVAIEDHWVERKPGRMPGNNAYLGVLAQLITGRAGLESLRRCLGQAAIELAEPICFDYGLGASIPTGRRVRSRPSDLDACWQADIADNPGLMLLARHIGADTVDPSHPTWLAQRSRRSAMPAASDHRTDWFHPRRFGPGRLYLSLVVPPAGSIAEPAGRRPAQHRVPGLPLSGPDVSPGAP